MMIKSRDGQMVEGHIPGLVAFYFFFTKGTQMVHPRGMYRIYFQRAERRTRTKATKKSKCE
jgi:hypothetical protein